MISGSLFVALSHCVLQRDLQFFTYDVWQFVLPETFVSGYRSCGTLLNEHSYLEKIVLPEIRFLVMACRRKTMLVIINCDVLYGLKHPANFSRMLLFKSSALLFSVQLFFFSFGRTVWKCSDKYVNIQINNLPYA